MGSEVRARKVLAQGSQGAQRFWKTEIGFWIRNFSVPAFQNFPLCVLRVLCAKPAPESPRASKERRGQTSEISFALPAYGAHWAANDRLPTALLRLRFSFSAFPLFGISAFPLAFSSLGYFFAYIAFHAFD